MIGNPVVFLLSVVHREVVVVVLLARARWVGFADVSWTKGGDEKGRTERGKQGL